MAAISFEGLSKSLDEIRSSLNQLKQVFSASGFKETFIEVSKYRRRKAYHYRLSERNRLHPKRKPKGGR